MILALSLTSCFSIYRNYVIGSINDKFKTDGYYLSKKNFTVFDKKSSSFSYIKFLDTQNRQLLFAHSKFPISPFGTIKKGSTFESSYTLKYNDEENYATILFDKTISSFANYTGSIKMEINVKVNPEGYLEGFMFVPNKKSKISNHKK